MVMELIRATSRLGGFSLYRVCHIFPYPGLESIPG
jgi:hypothetical protein